MRARHAHLVAAGLIAVLAAGCSDGTVTLRRGALGPASYRVELAVTGGPAVVSTQSASMRVEPRPDGASLRLTIGDEPPVVVELVRAASGQLALDSVQGISPTSAGEADLAAVVSQLDPPLPVHPVRLGDTWASTRSIQTETLDARLTSRLRAVRFRRVGSTDALEMRGTIAGVLRATGQTGTFSGSVTGETEIAWSLPKGRLASSQTRLVWSIPDAGRITVRTEVSPG